MKNLKLALGLILLTASVSWAQTPVCQPTFNGSLPLGLVNKLPNKKNPVNVQWQLDGKNLLVRFDVAQRVLNEKKVFVAAADYPFQYDVAEVFMAVSDPTQKNYHYYELEVTPNNQVFNVHFELVDGVLKREEGVNLSAQTSVNVAANSWTARFSIPLEQMGWEGNPQFIRANFYAITDKKPTRKFWSTFLPRMDKPNFNKPEFFKSLFTCK